MSIYTNKMRYNSLIPLTSDEKTLNNWFFQFFGPQKTPKTINRPKALKKISLRDFFDCFNLNRIRKTREEGRCANLNYNFLYWFSIQFLQSRPNFAVSKQETIHFFHEEKAKYHFLNMSHKFLGFFNLQKKLEAFKKLYSYWKNPKCGTTDIIIYTEILNLIQLTIDFNCWTAKCINVTKAW